MCFVETYPFNYCLSKRVVFDYSSRGKGIALMGEKAVDQQLIERIKKGEKGAFDVLVLKYQNKVVKLISRYVHDQSEALDVAQEAFIKAYRAIPNFHLVISHCY